MQIHLQKISKRFQRAWIFRDVSQTFASGGSYAILGSNGSGKSTLLQVISGYLTPTRGKIWYEKDGRKLGPEHFYQHITLATPYMELPEEFTLAEMVHFHSKFKKPLLSTQAFMERIELAKEKDKELKNFSSGMRQRVKLGLSLLFHSEIILLDEPTTHLDARATEWYRQLAQEYSEGRCLIISSNQEVEYDFCREVLKVEDYKR